MSKDTKEIICVGLAAVAILGVFLTGCIISDSQQYKYRLKALEATADCDPCQLMLLAKGIE